MNDVIFRFKLYIYDNKPKHRNLVKETREFFDEIFGENYNMEVLAINKNPEEAESDKVMAAPLLIKTTPPPRRVIGDLSNKDAILSKLDVDIKRGEFKSE